MSAATNRKTLHTARNLAAEKRRRLIKDAPKPPNAPNQSTENPELIKLDDNINDPANELKVNENGENRENEEEDQVTDWFAENWKPNFKATYPLRFSNDRRRVLVEYIHLMQRYRAKVDKVEALPKRTTNLQAQTLDELERELQKCECEMETLHKKRDQTNEQKKELMARYKALYREEDEERKRQEQRAILSNLDAFSALLGQNNVQNLLLGLSTDGVLQTNPQQTLTTTQPTTTSNPTSAPTNLLNPTSTPSNHNAPATPSTTTATPSSVSKDIQQFYVNLNKTVQQTSQHQQLPTTIAPALQRKPAMLNGGITTGTPVQTAGSMTASTSSATPTTLMGQPQQQSQPRGVSPFTTNIRDLSASLQRPQSAFAAQTPQHSFQHTLSQLQTQQLAANLQQQLAPMNQLQSQLSALASNPQLIPFALQGLNPLQLAQLQQQQNQNLLSSALNQKNRNSPLLQTPQNAKPTTPQQRKISQANSFTQQQASQALNAAAQRLQLPAAQQRSQTPQFAIPNLPGQPKIPPRAQSTRPTASPVTANQTASPSCVITSTPTTSAPAVVPLMLPPADGQPQINADLFQQILGMGSSDQVNQFLMQMQSLQNQQSQQQ